MSKRITLVTLFDDTEINKINDLMKKIQERTCKVPYGIDDENRFKIDNLPFHFTIFATNKENENLILNLANKINMEKIKLEIEEAEIMEARNDSFCLYFPIKENIHIKKLQEIFYNKLPNENYNPKNFTFHLTLHIDKDYEKVLSMKKIINEDFKPFSLEFNKLVLFNYPGDKIKEFNFMN